MWIRTSEPCSALTHMRAKLSYTIAILLRQYMMELLNCHLLSFTLILDSLIIGSWSSKTKAICKLIDFDISSKKKYCPLGIFF